MRYSASEKLEIIELVEQSTLSVGRTLASIGIPRSTFYDWYGRYQDGGIEALEDGKPRPQRVWNKIPDEIGAAIVNLALDEPDLSPRDAGVQVRATVAVERPPAPSYPAGARILRTELLSSSGDHARIDKGLLASLKANSMPRLTAGLFL